MRGWEAQNARVLDSTFHDGYCTSGRIKCPNCLVQTNTFSRTVIHAFYLVPAPVWLEGPMRAINMTVRGNDLTNVGVNPTVVVDAWAPGLMMVNNTFR